MEEILEKKSPVSMDETMSNDMPEKSVEEIEPVKQEEKENMMSETATETVEKPMASGDAQSSRWTENLAVEQKKEWGEPPTVTAETRRTPVISDLSSRWDESTGRFDAKQSEDSSRSKINRRTSNRRPRYYDVTNQLNFNTFRTSSWAGSQLQQQQRQQQQQRVPAVAGPRNSPSAGIYPPPRNLFGSAPHLVSNNIKNNNRNSGINNNQNSCSNNIINNNNNNYSDPLYLRNSNMGSAGISSAVLGHTPSPYQTTAHMNAYTGQHFTRPQNYHGFQQNLCNGYGSANSASGTMSRNGPRSSGLSTRRNSTGSPVAVLSSTNVYIRGLDQNTTDDDLRKMCAKFGRISSTKAIMDKVTGQCKRYGFVDFEEASDAQRAVEGLNQGGKVQAQMAKALSPNNQNSVFQQQEQDPTNLYMANLPPDYTEKDLQKLLENYGSTISTRVLKNGDGSSRCVGFARMDNEELCAKIIKEMNGKKVIPGYNLPLMVKYADSNKKTKSRPLQSVSGLHSSLTHLDFNQTCYATAPYDQGGQYIRSNPSLQYLFPTPSPYVHSPHPQFQFFSGYGDAPMGNLAAQMQSLSLQGANAAAAAAAAAMLQPPMEITNLGPGTSMTASQTAAAAAGAAAIPPVAMQTYTTVPMYPWPYGVQAAADPSMLGTVVTSATQLQNYVPELAAMHADAVAAAAAAATNQTSNQVVYTSHQPPPAQPPPQQPQPPPPQAAPMQQN